MVLTRRYMISGAGASMAASQVPTAVFARWEPSERYPDPAVEILDPSFAPYRLALARVERLATGFRWSEGPVWFGDGRYLLWSDIPNKSHHEMGGGNWARQCLPKTVQQRERKYPRS